MIDWVITFIQNNEFASGGLLITIAGSLLYSLKEIPFSLYRLAKEKLIFEIEVTDEGPLYRRLSGFMGEVGLNYRKLVARWDYDNKSLIMSPGVGSHLIFYYHTPILFERQRIGSERSDNPFRETLSLRTLRIWKEIPKRLIEEANNKFENMNTVPIRIASQYGWDEVCRVPKRDIGTVFLKTKIRDCMLEDIHQFRSSEDWYRDHGIPWRRGYLLEGPPGNGKTSLIHALASEINSSIEFLALNNKDMNDLVLWERVSGIGSSSLLVFEDLDRVELGSDQCKVTLQGLLSAFDGLFSGWGRLLIVTANEYEKIPEVLMRPGRIDRHYHIGNCTSHQHEMLCDSFGVEPSEVPLKGGDSVAEVQKRVLGQLNGDRYEEVSSYS